MKQHQFLELGAVFLFSKDVEDIMNDLNLLVASQQILMYLFTTN